MSSWFARPLVAALLLSACAAPVPRTELLASLEHRASTQRARSAAVERELAKLERAAPLETPDGGPIAYYELVTFRTSEPLDARYEPGLRAQLVQALEQSGTSALEYRNGSDAPLRFAPPWAEQEFRGVSLAALFASAYAAAPQFRGAEFDVRVPLDPGPDRRVTVIHEIDGRVAAVDSVASDPAQLSDGPTPDALRASYGIGPVDGWSAQERASLKAALELLRPAERALLAGLPFRRKGRASVLPLPGKRGRHCGHFALEQTQRSILIYDCAFEMDSHAFVGPLDQPLQPSVRVILHEIAHALSATRLGTLLADMATSQREAQQMVEEFNHLGRRVAVHEVAQVKRLQGEIEALQADLVRWNEELRGADQLDTSAVRAFVRVPGASSGLTSYGRISPVEAFAEAFSLCRTDPQAGRRISPDVCEFFDSDAYLDTGP